MAFHEYDYADTNNGEVNAEILHQEVVSEGGWTPDFEGVTLLPDTEKIRVVFDAALTGAELTALDDLIAAHDGVDTEGYDHTVIKVGLTSIAVVNWTEVLKLTTPPLSGGWYRVHAQFGMQTAVAPLFPFADFAEARLTENINGGGKAATQLFSSLFGSANSQSAIHHYEAKAGDVLEYTIDGRKAGLATCEIQDVTLAIEPYDGSVA